MKLFVILFVLNIVLTRKPCNYPAGIYLVKVNNINARTMCEICSKLAIKTLERR